MKNKQLKSVAVVMAFIVATLFHGVPVASAAYEGTAIAREAESGLASLYASTPAARALGEKAVGVMVFPSIVKGGFIFGGQYGQGALIKKGEVTDYYMSTAVSYGLQAGVQKFGYALFFMTQDDIDYIDNTAGWEVGVGPSIVVMDTGMANATTTTTAKSGVYAFFFSQKGLMAGLGLQGTKITKIYPID